jgi:hypothetical protein
MIFTKKVNRQWSLLYTSDSNGLSLNRFTSHLFNYKAPTILFVYCKDGTCYCVCSAVEYREAPIPYGDQQTRIYQIWPKLKHFDCKSFFFLIINLKYFFLCYISEKSRKINLFKYKISWTTTWFNIW